MHFVFNFYQVHKSQIQIRGTLIHCVNDSKYLPFPKTKMGGGKFAPYPKENGGQQDFQYPYSKPIVCTCTIVSVIQLALVTFVIDD